MGRWWAERCQNTLNALLKPQCRVRQSGPQGEWTCKQSIPDDCESHARLFFPMSRIKVLCCCINRLLCRLFPEDAKNGWSCPQQQKARWSSSTLWGHMQMINIKTQNAAVPLIRIPTLLMRVLLPASSSSAAWSTSLCTTLQVASSESCNARRKVPPPASKLVLGPSRLGLEPLWQPYVPVMGHTLPWKQTLRKSDPISRAGGWIRWQSPVDGKLSSSSANGANKKQF